MSLIDTELHDVLHRATDHLTTPPTLLDEVRRGGGRRLVRRRGLFAAGLAVALAASVVGVTRLPGAGGEIQVAAPLLDRPTRGDLAGDQAYLTRVRQEWRRHTDRLEMSNLAGGPHIVWAGSTPVGPAAFVAQRTATNPVVAEIGGRRERQVAVTAFVQPTANGPTVMTVETLTDRWNSISWAALLGPQRDVLVVVDPARPVDFSPEYGYAADGTIVRRFQPLAFGDGAAVLRVSPQRDKITIAVGTAPTARCEHINIVNTTDVLKPSGGGVTEKVITLPGAQRVWGTDPAATAQGLAYEQEVTAALARYIDPCGLHMVRSGPLWTVYAATPDGRRLLLRTLQYDDDPARAVAMLARGNGPLEAVAGGFVDPRAALHLRLRLPDGHGVLVIAAAGATLRYRVADGAWQDAGTEAALLPAAATEASVTRPDGSTATVALP